MYDVSAKSSTQAAVGSRWWLVDDSESNVLASRSTVGRDRSSDSAINHRSGWRRMPPAGSKWRRWRSLAENDDRGQSVLVEVDQAGSIHMGYDEPARQHLTYGMRLKDGRFQLESVPVPDAFFAYDFGLDSSGVPHVVLETRMRTVH